MAESEVDGSFVPSKEKGIFIRSKAANCCVVGCHNNYQNTEGKGISFYYFPNRTKNPKKYEGWVNAVRRVNVDSSEWNPTRHSRVCSVHFASGMQSNCPVNPSYVPSIFTDVYREPTHFSSSTENIPDFPIRVKTSKTNCCVVGCKNTYSNTNGVKFYSFPTTPWKKDQKEKWIAAVRRKRSDGLPRRSQRNRASNQRVVGPATLNSPKKRFTTKSSKRKKNFLADTESTSKSSTNITPKRSRKILADRPTESSSNPPKIKIGRRYLKILADMEPSNSVPSSAETAITPAIANPTVKFQGPKKNTCNGNSSLKQTNAKVLNIPSEISLVPSSPKVPATVHDRISRPNDTSRITKPFKFVEPNSCLPSSKIQEKAKTANTPIKLVLPSSCRPGKIQIASGKCFTMPDPKVLIGMLKLPPNVMYKINSKTAIVGGHMKTVASNIKNPPVGISQYNALNSVSVKNIKGPERCHPYPTDSVFSHAPLVKSEPVQEESCLPDPVDNSTGINNEQQNICDFPCSVSQPVILLKEFGERIYFNQSIEPDIKMGTFDGDEEGYGEI